MPEQYDRLQPYEVWDLEDAWRWRRDREWEQRAIVATLTLMAWGGKETSFTGLYDEIRFMLPGYRPPE